MRYDNGSNPQGASVAEMRAARSQPRGVTAVERARKDREIDDLKRAFARRCNKFNK